MEELLFVLFFKATVGTLQEVKEKWHKPCQAHCNEQTLPEQINSTTCSSAQFLGTASSCASFLTHFLLHHLSPHLCHIKQVADSETPSFSTTHTGHITLVDMHHLMPIPQTKHAIKTEEPVKVQ